MIHFLEGIFIFDSFFIGLSNVIINFLLNVLNLLLSFADNIGNLSNNRIGGVFGGDSIKNLLSGRFRDLDNDDIGNQSSGVFRNPHNDDIFEELESRYSKDKRDENDGMGFLRNSNAGYDDSEFKGTNNGFDENLKKDFFNEFLENRNLLNLGSLIRIGAVLLSLLIIVVMFVSYFISFEIGLVILLLFALLTIAFIYLPQIKRQNKYSQFSKELPYALRQLSTELRSGKSLFDSLDSVANADYGVLSLEFSRLLREVRYGESTENAFIHLNSRVKSKGLSRASSEILSTLRVGGNLSNSLSIIAEDINFDMRMKLKEYSQKLNAFIMIYTFLAILAPVIILTLLLAASVVMGDVVPANLILVLYGLFFPMIIVFLGFFIKKLEPNV